jgi:tRNA(His) 5'-end guanylyltransferase
MVETTRYLCQEIQGAKCAYTQSDEISILLTDFDTLTIQAWFDNNIQKIVSISASLTSVKFTELFDKQAIFDSRCFNLPKEEVCNYFIWRQKDWFRNSVSMLAQSIFSAKQLHQKSQSDMHEMLHEKGVNWTELETRWKNGTTIYKENNEWYYTPDIIFTEKRDFIDTYLLPKED